MERGIEEFDLTREEMIAALVEDSIGYLSPRGAELHIRSWERGEEACHCERCCAVFECELEKCLESAKRRWEHLTEEKRGRLLKIVEQVSKLEAVDQATVGLMWPTMV